MSAFIVATMSQVEIAAGFLLAELRGMVDLVRDGTAPIPSSPPEAAVVELPAPKEPEQTVFMLRSAKFRHHGKMRFLPRWEDATLPVETAQKALRLGVATTTSDERRKQLRGSRSGAIDPKGIDVVDLDEVELPAEKYIGPDEVLRAANFTVIPTRDRLRQLASGRT